ncbi:hypothetical protein MHY1_02889 [Methylovirgula sp. HY1]|nr:hypothetical protein MHY1_02889 [Methylovirgula sp. HY1]
MNPDCFWLTDAQFAKIAPHLPTDTLGKARVDDRRVIKRHHPRAEIRRTLDRCAAGIRAEKNPL